jgi:hypothetical protein
MSFTRNATACETESVSRASNNLYFESMGLLYRVSNGPHGQGTERPAGFRMVSGLIVVSLLPEVPATAALWPITTGELFADASLWLVQPTISAAAEKGGTLHRWGFFLEGTKRRIHRLDEHHQSSVRREYLRATDPDTPSAVVCSWEGGT